MISALEVDIIALMIVISILCVGFICLSFIRDIAYNRRKRSLVSTGRLGGANSKLKRGMKDGKIKIREKESGLDAIIHGSGLMKAMVDDEVSVNLILANFRKKSDSTVFVLIRLVSPVLLYLLIFVILRVFFTSYSTGLIGGLAPLFGAVIGYFLPKKLLISMAKTRQKSISDAWPDALDLIILAIESGMSIQGAFKRIGLEIAVQSMPLAEELAILVSELAYLPSSRDAYNNFVDRTKIPLIKDSVVSLLQSEKYGTSLRDSLKVVSVEGRENRVLMAKEKAGSLGPKMIIPVAIFILPVLLVLLIFPGIYKAFAGF